MGWRATRERPLTLVYDGSCRFCTAGSERLVRLGAPGVVRRVSSKSEREMATFPAAVREGIGGALQLVSPEGEVASGAAAVNRVLATRGAWRLIAWLYWAPGVRQLTDAIYTIVARNRYRIMGKTDGCETGACKAP